MTSEKMVSPERVFDFCNTPLKDIGGQLKGDCPLCDAKNHLFVAADGRWDCKKCMESGNIYTFIRTWHANLLTEHPNAFLDLVPIRPGIGKKTFSTSNIAWDGEAWIIPAYSVKEGVSKIISLRRWIPETKEMLSCPTLSQGLYIAKWTDNPNAKVWITEGEWDALAWARCVTKVGEDDIVISVPGAGAWPERYLGWISGREVRFLFDNDAPKERKNKIIRPGFDGMHRVVDKALGMGASSVLLCGWKDTNAPMDVRDYVISKGNEISAAFNDINSMLVSPEEFRAMHGYQSKGTFVARPTELPPPINSYDELIDEFRKVYEVSEMFEKCIACALATCVSNLLQGDQLWMFLVGPPSSGKTSIIEAFAKAHKYTFHLSKLTSQALVSGQNRGEDPSILPKLTDKCLFVKDFTAILALPAATQEELFGMLRDAYDRNVRVQYGNGAVRVYQDLNFTLFAGCTDEIYAKNHSSLGERFLKIEILDSSFSPTAQARAALMGLNTKVDLTQVQTKVYGYLRYLYESFSEPGPVDEETTDWLVSVAAIVSYLRTKVRREEGNMAFRPRSEVPTRIAMQLRKLYLSLKITTSTKDENWYREVVEKVAMDSCIGWALEFVAPVLKRKTGITTQEIADLCQVAPNHVVKVLRDMQQIGIVTSELGANNTGRPGRQTNYWLPEERFLELWETASISHKAVKKFTPSKKAKRSKV